MGRIISYIMEKMFETTNQIKYYDCHQPVPWCSEKRNDQVARNRIKTKGESTSGQCSNIKFYCTSNRISIGWSIKYNQIRSHENGKIRWPSNPSVPWNPLELLVTRFPLGWWFHLLGGWAWYTYTSLKKNGLRQLGWHDIPKIWKAINMFQSTKQIINHY